eukprot:7825831-Prorocentrum_lima.AAC.1
MGVDPVEPPPDTPPRPPSPPDESTPFDADDQDMVPPEYGDPSQPFRPKPANDRSYSGDHGRTSS